MLAGGETAPLDVSVDPAVMMQATRAAAEALAEPSRSVADVEEFMDDPRQDWRNVEHGGVWASSA